MSSSMHHIAIYYSVGGVSSWGCGERQATLNVFGSVYLARPLDTSGKEIIVWRNQVKATFMKVAAWGP